MKPLNCLTNPLGIFRFNPLAQMGKRANPAKGGPTSKVAKAKETRPWADKMMKCIESFV